MSRDGDPGAAATAPAAPARPDALDSIDTAILRELSRDARTSFARIGAVVNLSAPAVKRRVDRLRETGVIDGFTVRLDPGHLGWSTEAHVEVYCQGATSPRRCGRPSSGTRRSWQRAR